MIRHIARKSGRRYEMCPDCKQAVIYEHDRCDVCGLSWEDLEAAAEMLASFALNRKRTR